MKHVVIAFCLLLCAVGILTTSAACDDDAPLAINCESCWQYPEEDRCTEELPSPQCQEAAELCPVSKAPLLTEERFCCEPDQAAALGCVYTGLLACNARVWCCPASCQVATDCQQGPCALAQCNAGACEYTPVPIDEQGGCPAGEACRGDGQCWPFQPLS